MLEAFLNIKTRRVTPRDTKDKGYFFAALVSQVNLNAMKRIFEQWSELQIAKCLRVQVLSSGYNVSELKLWYEKKVTQQLDLPVANDIVLNKVRVYHEGVYADNVVIKFWFVRSFFSQHDSKFIANIATENVSHVRAKECKTRSFICKVNISFLSSSRHFEADTAFAVKLFSLNERTQGFNTVYFSSNGKVKTGFQKFKLIGLWNFFCQKTQTFPIWHFGTLMGKIVPKLQPPFDLPNSVAPVKSL